MYPLRAPMIVQIHGSLTKALILLSSAESAQLRYTVIELVEVCCRVCVPLRADESLQSAIYGVLG